MMILHIGLFKHHLWNPLPQDVWRAVAKVVSKSSNQKSTCCLWAPARKEMLGTSLRFVPRKGIPEGTLPHFVHCKGILEGASSCYIQGHPRGHFRGDSSNIRELGGQSPNCHTSESTSDYELGNCQRATQHTIRRHILPTGHKLCITVVEI